MRFVFLLCFSMLFCKYVLLGINAKGRSWYSTKCIPLSSQTAPGSCLQSLTHHGVSVGKPRRFNTERMALPSGNSPMLIKTPRCYLYPSEEKEFSTKKTSKQTNTHPPNNKKTKPKTTKNQTKQKTQTKTKKPNTLVMHGMWCKLLKQTGSQELAVCGQETAASGGSKSCRAGMLTKLPH